MTTAYVVSLPLPGSDLSLDLCRCSTPQSVAAVLAALLVAGSPGPFTVRPVEDYTAPQPLLGQVVVSVEDLSRVLAALDALLPGDTAPSSPTVAAAERLRAVLPPF